MRGRLERETYRNGYRDRQYNTRLGTLDLRIPKLREDTYFPPFLEARRLSEKALNAVIQEVWINGVSTRKVDALVQSMGMAALLHQTLLTRSVIHADETTLQLLDTRKGGAAQRGYLWSYVSGEKTGDAVVCFERLPGRGSQYPTSFWSGWSGHLVTDDYAAYKAIAKQIPGVINTGCWSHVRRRFADLYKANHDPRAGMALKMMSHLFRLESKISLRPPEKSHSGDNGIQNPYWINSMPG